MRKPTALFLVLFSLLLIWQFLRLNVLQDDAFISFRYVRNFLDGFGLVFNIGERVEGYTNFFWIILLALLTKLGLPLIETARAVGVLGAVGTLGICVYAAQRYYPQRDWLWIAAAPLLLAANGALAYWAGSGLETGLFTLLATAAAITYFTNLPLSLLLIALAILTRPEGALLAFLFGLAGIILKQKSWKATFVYWGALAGLMLPYAVFKWFYFGSLLPNPFYAKTGFSTEYWQSGMEYAAIFFKHYGLYGAALLLPLIFWKKLNFFSRFGLIVFLGYTLYVVSVGGDVLKAHRFFVPVLPYLCFPAVDALHRLFENLRPKNIAFGFAAAALAVYSFSAPLSYLKNSAEAERGFLATNMINSALFFAGQQSAGSFALTTIGAFSYYVGTARVLDMLGLTDPVIARKPEKIEGMKSSWKERNFNAGYVLSQKPDVILFSTGLKPSAPAERALFLYPDFRQNYRAEFFLREQRSNNYYRRFRDLPVGTRSDQPLSFVHFLNEGINQIENDNPKALSSLRRALEKGPTDCAILYALLGYTYNLLGAADSAEFYCELGMRLDEGGTITRSYYRDFLYKQGRFAEVAAQDSALGRAVPGYFELLRLLGQFQ